MRNATVATQLRGPDVGVNVIYADRIEHCEPASSTTPETPPPTPTATAPDLAVQEPLAYLIRSDDELSAVIAIFWFATVANIGEATAPTSTIRLYYGERELDSLPVRQEIAAGATWHMTDGVGRQIRNDNIPPEGATVRVCVDPVPGEPESKRANNCASVTVERN